MQSQIRARSRRFHSALWEKLVKISPKIGSEWEENYSCTKAVLLYKIYHNREDSITCLLYRQALPGITDQRSTVHLVVACRAMDFSNRH